MKTLKILSFLLALTLTNCATTSNFAKNDLKNEFFKNKTITFTLNEKSKMNVSYSGPRAGFERQPDVKEAFKKSIEELAYETKLDLKFTETSNTASTSEMNVDAEVTEILWVFNLSSATMKTTINYTLKNDPKVHTINSNYKNMTAGNEKNNLIRTFKIANYSLLKELEK
tara:strand:+ start:390 stop:899 length:510 start_codon:yes stop_codon:yes gene_type:complete